jgi:hypothetical protein
LEFNFEENEKISKVNWWVHRVEIYHKVDSKEGISFVGSARHKNMNYENLNEVFMMRQTSLSFFFSKDLN